MKKKKKKQEKKKEKKKRKRKKKENTPQKHNNHIEATPPNYHQLSPHPRQAAYKLPRRHHRPAKHLPHKYNPTQHPHTTRQAAQRQSTVNKRKTTVMVAPTAFSHSGTLIPATSHNPV